MADLSDFGIEFDDDGRLVGFQAGKAAALLDWEHRKAAGEFRRLCRRLYYRTYGKRERLLKPELVAARKRRHASKHWEAIKLYQKLRRRSKKKPWTLRCEQCGTVWVKERGTRESMRRSARFCSKACNDRHWQASVRNGTDRRRARLTQEQVSEIRRRAETETRVALQKEFSVSRAQLWRIVFGECWTKPHSRPRPADRWSGA